MKSGHIIALQIHVHTENMEGLKQFSGNATITNHTFLGIIAKIIVSRAKSKFTRKTQTHELYPVYTQIIMIC